MERIHIDFAGPIKSKYLCIVVDAYSHWPEVFVTNDMTAATVKRCLRKMFSRLGVAETIVSDNGPGFIAEDVNEWLNRIGCTHLTTAPHHPKSNGMAERMVRTIKEQIAVNVGKSLDEVLDRFLLVYRNTPYGDTGIPPSILMVGRLLRSSHSALLQKPVHAWEPSTGVFKPAEVITGKGPQFQVRLNGRVQQRHQEQLKFLPVRRSKRQHHPPHRYGFSP